MADMLINRFVSILAFFVLSVEKVNIHLARVISWINIIMMILMVYHVAMRYFIGSPSSWALPLTGQLFALYWLIVGGYLLVEDAHVRMDVVYRLLSPRKKSLLNLFTFTLFFFYCGLVLIYGWDWFLLSYEREARMSGLWRPLLWPFRLVVPVSFALILLAGITSYIRDLYMVLTGRDLA